MSSCPAFPFQEIGITGTEMLQCPMVEPGTAAALDKAVEESNMQLEAPSTGQSPRTSVR